MSSSACRNEGQHLRDPRLADLTQAEGMRELQIVVNSKISIFSYKGMGVGWRCLLAPLTLIVFFVPRKRPGLLSFSSMSPLNVSRWPVI